MKPTIDQLEAFFRFLKYPQEPICISPAEKIIDPEKFVKSHLELVKHKGIEKSTPYYERLIILKQKLAPMPIYK